MSKRTGRTTPFDKGRYAYNRVAANVLGDTGTERWRTARRLQRDLPTVAYTSYRFSNKMAHSAPVSLYGAIAVLPQGRLYLAGKIETQSVIRAELSALVALLERLEPPHRILLFVESWQLYRNIRHLDRWAVRQWTRLDDWPLADQRLWRKLYGLASQHSIRWKLSGATPSVFNHHTREVTKLAFDCDLGETTVVDRRLYV